MIKDNPFELKVNDRYDFKITPEAAQALDIVPDGDGHYHLLHDGKAYKAALLEHDERAHSITLLINQRKYVVKIADYYDRLVQSMGLTLGSSHKINELKAPMPGLVLDIAISPGQSVQKGDTLLILEAMKMENVLKAAGEGVVKAIHIHKGQAVEKGLLLVEFE